MSIVTGSTRASELATSGETNNPFVLWDNDIATITATSGVATGGTASNAISGWTYDAAMPLDTAGVYRLEFTVPAAITCVGVAAHNFGTVSANCRVQYWDGSAWQDSGAGPVIPTDDQAIIFRFDSRNPTKWSLAIFDSPTAQPVVGVLMAGNELILPRRIYQGYAPPITPNRVTLQSNVTVGGHLSGAATISEGSDANASFTYVAPTFIRGASFKGFMQHFNEGNGFFWAWRPTKYGDAFFAWRSGNVIAPSNTGPADFMGFDMGMRFHDDP